jgi:hypothetical protein
MAYSSFLLIFRLNCRQILSAFDTSASSFSVIVRTLISFI